MNVTPRVDTGSGEKADIRDAMASYVTGITVVTTRFEGRDYGMTCNSFNSVSLEPPMVLWSVQRSAGSYTAFTQGGGYAVSILSESQHDLVGRFTKGPYEERFQDVETRRLETERRIIEGAVAWFDCAIENVVEAGDHDVLIGRVIDFGCDPTATPLAYARGRFRAMDG